MLVKNQHLLTSLRKTERNIFVPSGLVTGVFEELPMTSVIFSGFRSSERFFAKTGEERLISPVPKAAVNAVRLVQFIRFLLRGQRSLSFTEAWTVCVHTSMHQNHLSTWEILAYHGYILVLDFEKNNRKLFKNPCSQAELNKIVPFGFSLQRQKMVFFAIKIV